ncbi:MAG: RluA family pseudouridine synthase [Deltaproteobacteria bacterium]|nr:RluA family pseudouridine synthase [Deltaproteobacteria bacterium]
MRATAEHAGRRLDVVIAEAGNGLTRSQVKTLISKGLVSIGGAPATKAGLLLEAGQRVTVAIPAIAQLDLTPQDVGIHIIHEDEDLAVVEKPAGISVHPSDTEKQATMVHGLLHKLKSLSSIGGTARPGIVHRIDKGTSGILVVTKTDAAHLGLSRQFKEHTIDRRYQALVYGDLNKSKAGSSGRIETFFGRSPTDRKKMTGKLAEGRRAVTHWKVLEPLGGLTLVECRLGTGRTHQIRVHLSELGFPLVGDPTYCDNERKARALAKNQAALARVCQGVGRQLLHANYLGFTHPITGRQLMFESPLPADFQAVLDAAR